MLHCSINLLYFFLRGIGHNRAGSWSITPVLKGRGDECRLENQARLSEGQAIAP